MDNFIKTHYYAHVVRMVGNHNSGRKKTQDSENVRMGKKTLYIRQTYNEKTGKWIDDPIFQWFKRHHGAAWQSQVRDFMAEDVYHWKRTAFWRCKCFAVGLLGNYVPNKVPKCHICDTWKNKISKLQHGGRR